MKQARWFRTKKSATYLARPGIVTAIALAQFAKAGVILLVTLLVWQRPGSQYHAGVLWELSDILTHGRSGLDFMAPVFAGYALAVGCGLWMLEKWARRTLMVTSALTALFWIFGVVVNRNPWSDLAESLSISSYNQQNLFAIILIESAVFLYLAFGREVPEAFHRFDPPHI